VSCKWRQTKIHLNHHVQSSPSGLRSINENILFFIFHIITEELGQHALFVKTSNFSDKCPMTGTNLQARTVLSQINVHWALFCHSNLNTHTREHEWEEKSKSLNFFNNYIHSIKMTEHILHFIIFFHNFFLMCRLFCLAQIAVTFLYTPTAQWKGAITFLDAFVDSSFPTYCEYVWWFTFISLSNTLNYKMKE